MEETYYYMKSTTAWTFAHWFKDAKYWEDSLLIDGMPPSSSLIKDRFSESVTAVDLTSQTQGHEADKPSEHLFQSSADIVQCKSLSRRNAQRNYSPILHSPMEEKYYCLKAGTGWTFAHWFEDGDFWIESLKTDGVPPSSSLIKDRFSDSAMVIDQSSEDQLLQDDKPGEIDILESTDEMQGESAGAGRPSRSLFFQNINSSSSKTPVKKQHACSLYDKLFRRPSELVGHSRTHSGAKPFGCTYCGNSFAQKASLQQHLKTHTDHRLFPCTQCSYKASKKSHLIRHLRTHTDERPFSCVVCGKSFKDPSNLREHKRIHNNMKPYSCSTCGKSFTQSSNLKTHLITHTNEKPFQCENCGKCFTVKGSLKVHMRIHSGEKPFSCQTCGKNFRISAQCHQHSQRCKRTITSS